MLTPPAMRDLRHEMTGAGDDKIRRIVAMMDKSPVPEAAQAILDPLRPRLALLRPARPLRFSRLLFLPLDPVVVPAREWRKGDATIPRGILVSFGETVHAALGPEAEEIDRLIAGRETTDEATIAKAGAWLWSRAGAILAAVPTPIGWEATGLPLAVFPTLARAIACVLSRAVQLRDLVRDSVMATRGTQDNAVRDLLAGLAAESQEGFGMVVAVLLARMPDATPLLQRLIVSGRGTADSAMLRQAMDQSLDGMLRDLESGSGLENEVLRVPLRHAGQEAQRIVNLLLDIDNEPDAARHRPRLKAIRLKLDQDCRTLFGDELAAGLVTPLATAGQPLTAADQTGIEVKIRELRALETAARKIGGAKVYDALLAQAAATARTAAETGILTQVRHMRLVEILAGPEAAEALYPRAA